MVEMIRIANSRNCRPHHFSASRFAQHIVRTVPIRSEWLLFFINNRWFDNEFLSTMTIAFPPASTTTLEPPSRARVQPQRRSLRARTFAHDKNMTNDRMTVLRNAGRASLYRETAQLDVAGNLHRFPSVRRASSAIGTYNFIYVYDWLRENGLASTNFARAPSAQHHFV